MTDGMVAVLGATEAARLAPGAGRSGPEGRAQGRGFAAMLDAMGGPPGQGARAGAASDAATAMPEAPAAGRDGVERGRPPDGGAGGELSPKGEELADPEGTEAADDPPAEATGWSLPSLTMPSVGGDKPRAVAPPMDGEELAMEAASFAANPGEQRPNAATAHPGEAFQGLGRGAKVLGSEMPRGMPQGVAGPDQARMGADRRSPGPTTDLGLGPGAPVAADETSAVSMARDKLTEGASGVVVQAGPATAAAAPQASGGMAWKGLSPPAAPAAPSAAPVPDGGPSEASSGRGPLAATPPAAAAPGAFGLSVAASVGGARGRGPGTAEPPGRTDAARGLRTDAVAPTAEGTAPGPTSPGSQTLAGRGEPSGLPSPGPEPGRAWSEAAGAERPDSVLPLARTEAGPSNPFPAGEGGVARHIARQLAAHPALRTGGTAEMTLSPEELGPLRLSVEAVDGGLRLVIEAVRPETADLMRRHLEALRQELRQDGLGSVGVAIGGGDARRGGEAAGGFAAGGGGAGAPPFGTDREPEPAVAPQAVARSRGPGGHLDLRF